MRPVSIRAGSIFISAFVLRLIALWQLRAMPLFRTPELDALEYLSWAQRIARGDFWPGAAPIHGPGYPLFAGAVLFLGRNSEVFLQIVQSLLGATTALLLFDLGRRMYGLRCGTIAGVLYATYAPLLLVETSLLAEGLLIFLLVLAAWLLALPPSGFRVTLAGIAIGCAVITRPTALLFIPLFACFIKPRKLIAIFVLSAAYPIAPVLLQSWFATGHVVMVQSAGGANLYIGDSPLHGGFGWARPGGPWDRVRGEAWRAGARDAASDDRYFVQKTMREIADHPLAFVRLIAMKTFWFLQADEIRDSGSFAFFAARVPLLRYGPGFGVTLALAVAGFIVALRERKVSWLLIGWIAIAAATTIGLIVGMRYRLPVVPPLMIFAGLAFSMRHARTVVLAGLLAFVCTHLLVHQPSHMLAEEWAMTALSERREGNLNKALQTALCATTVDPSMSLVWLTLGDIDSARNDWPAAEVAWQHALTVDPCTSRAWSHLGLARMRRGDDAGAEQAWIRAASIKADIEPLQNLAMLYMRQNRLDDARRAAETMLAISDRNVDAYIFLARIALAKNEPKVAAAATEAAAAIAPDSPDVRRLQGMVNR